MVVVGGEARFAELVHRRDRRLAVLDGDEDIEQRRFRFRTLELEGIEVEAPLLDVFFATAPGESAVGPVYTLRKLGFSAGFDQAGRSLKGQVSFGQKHARVTVVVEAEGWTVRRQGELDVTVHDVDELKELLA